MAEQNQRIFKWDIMRFIGVVFVFSYHYDIENSVHGLRHLLSHTGYGNMNLGGIGVMLFFLLSGGVHRKYREERNEFKSVDYYKKRVLSIYPKFYIAYLIAFVIVIILQDEVLLLFGNIEKWKILLTLIGADGYFPQFGTTFYLVGEWFTTVIIIIYIVFPLLRICMKKSRCSIGFVC